MPAVTWDERVPCVHQEKDSGGPEATRHTGCGSKGPSQHYCPSFAWGQPVGGLPKAAEHGPRSSHPPGPAPSFLAGLQLFLTSQLTLEFYLCS